MVELVENLRTALGERIDGLEWMGDETKKEAHKKLASFNPKIAYPDVWRDLSSLEIVPGDLFTNAQNISAFNYADQLGRLKRSTNRDEWFMTPQTVNAYYCSFALNFRHFYIKDWTQITLAVFTRLGRL